MKEPFKVEKVPIINEKKIEPFKVTQLICSSCKKSVRYLIGGECEECAYLNQHIDRVLECSECSRHVGYYRRFDRYQEFNQINEVLCPDCNFKRLTK